VKLTDPTPRQAERTSASVTKKNQRTQRVRQLQQELDRMTGLVRQVMKQTKGTCIR